MGEIITARGIGGPDFADLSRFPSRNVVSDSKVHFTSALAKNESEQENLTGLVSNKALIRNVAINSAQALHFRLEFYSRDSFTNSDLDVDTFLGAVDLDLSEYGQLA